MDSAGLFTSEPSLEQFFSATDTFGTDSDAVSVWELVSLLKRATGRDGTKRYLSATDMSAKHADIKIQLFLQNFG